jgi:hypothetical protein
MTMLTQPVGELVLEQITGMIGSEGDAHAAYLASNIAARHRSCRASEQFRVGRVRRLSCKGAPMSITRRVGTWLERVVYVVAGLPIAIHGAAVAATSEARLTRRAFARRYWRPSSIREMSELAVGLMLAPIAVPIAAIWFTVRNGLAIRRREGKGLARQFFE